MNLNNNMEGKFGLIWYGENNLHSQVKVARHGSEELSCSVKVVPSNRMEGEIVLRQPPVTIKEYAPVKDAYVSEAVSKLNYGKSNIMKVGTDVNGKKYRAFMDFNISDLPRNMFIAEALLEITSYDDSDFEYLELSSAMKEYEEYGLTWDNQVARDKLISIETLDRNTKKYTFNVTDVVANDWYGKDFNNHGLILKGYDESKVQLKEFMSKESYNPPKLIVKYMDLATYESGGSKITGNVKVRTSHNNGITGNVTVNRYDDFHLFPAHVYVHNPAWIESSVFVTKTRLLSDVLVKAQCPIIGNVQVRIVGTPSDIIGNVVVKQEHIKCNVIVKRPKTLLANVFVRRSESSEIISNVIVNGNIIKGNVKVKAQEGLPCNVQVKVSEFNGIISNVVINNNIIKGNVCVKAQSELTSNVTVINRPRLDVIGSVYVNTNIIKCNVNVRGKGDSSINAKVDVRAISVFNGSVTISKLNLPSSVKVLQHSSLISSVSIRGREELDGNVRVRLTRYKGMVGSVKAKAQVSLNGQVQVNSQFLHASVNIKKFKTLLGRVRIKTFDSLQSSVEVVYKNDMHSNVVIRVSEFVDFNCSVIVGSTGRKRSYVFIM